MVSTIKNRKFTNTIIIMVFIFIAGLFGNNIAQAEEQQLNSINNKPVVVVSSTGTVSVVPDQAQVSMAVVKRDPNLGRALASNNSTAEKLINTLKQAGIEPADIKTTNFNVYPQYDYSQSEARVIGYEVRNELTVIVKDLDKLGSILDLAITTGANNLNYITFQKADTSAAENEALTQAVNRAREKAAVLANAVGNRLGKVESINEGFTEPIRYNSSISADMIAGLGKEAAVPVLPGDINITANVTVIYEME